MRPLVYRQQGDELVAKAEQVSLYILSMLEFQNEQGSGLIFSQNVDERIQACKFEILMEHP